MKDEHVNDINNYQKLYMQYAPMLLRFAGKFISPFFAEDIVHDVFLKIWDKQVFLLSESEVKNILFVAVRNACIDHLRRISLEQEFADKRAIQLKLDELSFYDGADELFMRKDLMAHVMAKINELPEKRREIFLLSYMEGLKAAEIAERLNLSTRTVENQLYRTLLFLRGDELCRMVKENPDTSGIPVVLLTAKANHEAIVEGLKKGADDYIPKPFSTEILKLKVQGLIDNRNRQRQFFMRQAIAQVEAGGKRDDNESNESIDNKNVTTASETMAEGDRRFIMQATRFVLEHLDEPDFNINLLCHEMAMSRTLFYSRLKSLTGKGPQEFIRIIRLQKAAELLKEGKSVTDVAAETGFVNTKYFSSLFKKQFGMQPSKYSGK